MLTAQFKYSYTPEQEQGCCELPQHTHLTAAVLLSLPVLSLQALYDPAFTWPDLQTVGYHYFIFCLIFVLFHILFHWLILIASVQGGQPLYFPLNAPISRTKLHLLFSMIDPRAKMGKQNNPSFK